MPKQTDRSSSIQLHGSAHSSPSGESEGMSTAPGEAPLKEMLATYEKTVLLNALEQTDWHVPQAASLLDIAQSWLYKRIKKYNLKRDDDDS